MKVIKRDGTTVDFDLNKIVVAIQKANIAVEPEYRIEEEKIHKIAENVQARNRKRLLVEDIQDMVEHSLMDEGKFECADLITDRFTLEEMPEVMDGIKNGTRKIVKAVYVNQ